MFTIVKIFDKIIQITFRRTNMLEKHYDFKTKEKFWQDKWTQDKTYKFDPSATNRYMIDTPPPTISGNIHMGHVYSYLQIDVIARHQRMLHKSVFFPFGYDDNGLPTEHYIQRSQKIKMNEISRSDFVKICADTTVGMKDIYRDIFRHAGISADFENTYSTYSPNTQKISQQSFIELYKSGAIERKNAPGLWCPECRTAIAQSEVETEELDSFMNYISFGVEGSDERIKIATTRPELLCACVCVFVHPGDKSRIHLVGKTAISPIYNKKVPIIANPDVALDKGTGAVMCCTFGDEADSKWQKEYDLPILEAISYNGKMTALAGEFEGQKVTEARKNIIEKLRETGILYDQQPITHAVSTHDRCGTAIEIIAKPQWFIKLLDKKDKIYEAGEKVKWYPEHMQKRFLNWVEGLKWDWCISRQRYFGVPFPIWYCKDCGEIILANEEDLPIDPSATSPKCACPKCGSHEFIAETDVMDTWATSSLTPQIACDLITHKGLDDTYTPMDLRPNAHDNIRVWDFYTIAKSLLHFGKLPWENVMISGWGLSATGTKLSKSKSNGGTLSPDEAYQKYSADVTRYWASNASLGKDVYIKDEEFNNGFKLMQKLWNASRFVLSFMEGYERSRPSELLPMDAWILNCYSDTYLRFQKAFEKYEMGLALNEVEKLFWNFCDNYIEIAKNRLYKPEIYGEEAKQSAQYASSTVLLGLLKMLSIYMPHITEEIYQDYFAKFEGNGSIHTSGYLLPTENLDEKLRTNGNIVCDIVAEIRGYKSRNNMSLKEELTLVEVTCDEPDFIEECADDISAVGNVKELKISQGEFKVNINN